METRNSVLTGRSGELMKMAILRMQETKIMDRAGISFRISNMRQKQSILCKVHTSRNEAGMSFRINKPIEIK